MGKLFAAIVAVIALVSAGVFVARIWWLPPDISTLGPAIEAAVKDYATDVRERRFPGKENVYAMKKTG